VHSKVNLSRPKCRFDLRYEEAVTAYTAQRTMLVRVASGGDMFQAHLQGGISLNEGSPHYLGLD
jgi:hypothetical protein